MSIKQYKGIVVFFQGSSGIGKTTVGNYVAEQLNQQNLRSVTLDSPIGQHHRTFCYEFEKTLDANKGNIVIVQNDNNYLDEFKELVARAEKRDFVTIFFSPSEQKNSKLRKLLILVCMQSLFQRSENCGVQLRKILYNLCNIKNNLPDTKSKLRETTNMSETEYAKYLFDSVNYIVDHFVEIDYLDEKKLKTYRVSQIVMQWFNWYYHELIYDIYQNNTIQKDGKRKELVQRSSKNTVKSLQLSKANYQQLRLPVETIGQKIIDKVLEVRKIIIH